MAVTASRSIGHPLSREFIATQYRERIGHALARCVAEQGWHSVTVSDVVSRAGIARNGFYDHFPNREAAAQLVMVAAIKGAKRAAADGGTPALVAYCAGAPHLATLVLVEGHTISPAIYHRALDDFAEVLEPLDPHRGTMVVGGGVQVLRRAAREGWTDPGGVTRDLDLFLESVGGGGLR